MTDEILENEQEQEALPGASLLEYLPEIYRNQAQDNFLEHFLSPFASMLNEFDEKISSIPDYFDPATVPPPDELTGDFIPWLAQWLSLDLYELLGEKNKEFILKAVEFYKQKGTPQGLANLVSFLTGKDCCVKEFMNNVFRSYGMEHVPGIENNNQPEEDECLKFYHKTSRTVDTSKCDLLAKMHNQLGYEDEMHYVYDTRISGKYARNVIGLYIFIDSHTQMFQFEKEQLHKIIRTFLPVFVRLEIFIVERIDYYEQYPLSNITETYDVHVEDTDKEVIKPLTGVYSNSVNWNWLITNNKNEGLTNNVLYRTPHSDIGVKILL